MTRRQGWLWLVCAALCAGSVTAHAAAGRVLYSTGTGQIKRDGAALPMERGLAVEARDEITVGAASRAQLRMSDGALVALQPLSTLVIDQFTFPSAKEESGGLGTSFFKLLKGGLRTVTGLIGKRSGDRYQVGTPVATIGVRGTDYRIVLCQADCGDSPDGLYLGVSDGSIVVTNAAGELVLLDNEFAYVAGPDSAPKLLLTPPAALEPNAESGEEDCHCDQSENDPGYRDVVILGKLMFGQGARSLAYSTSAPDVGGIEAVAAAESSPPISVNSFGELVAFRGIAGNQLAGFSIGDALITNVGFDPATGVRWGRWTDSSELGGSGVDLASHDLHWIVGPQASTLFALTLAGSATYDLVGNTNPTDSQGHIGTLGTASLTANFTSQTLANTLSLSINEQIWTASGTAQLHAPSPLFAGSYTQVTAGAAHGTGSFAGFFVAPASSDNLPAGAGLSYSLHGGGNTVNGTAAFGSKH
jgi:hypothetical protein